MKRRSLWTSRKVGEISRRHPGTELLNCCDLQCDESSTGKQYFVYLLRTGADKFEVHALYGPGSRPTSSTAAITKKQVDMKIAAKEYALQIRRKIYGKNGGTMSVYRPLDAMSASEVAVMAGIRTQAVLEAIVGDDMAVIRALQHGIMDPPFIDALLQEPPRLAVALQAKPEIVNDHMLLAADGNPMLAAVILANSAVRDPRLIRSAGRDNEAAKYAVEHCEDDLGLRVNVASTGVGSKPTPAAMERAGRDRDH